MPAAGETVCLHGDVHLKNGLVQGRRVALIDLDQAGAGPPAADLGSAVAGAPLPAPRRRRGHPRRARAARAARRLRRRARRCRRATSCDWHVAAALLSERALRAVNRIRPDGLVHLGAVLADARAVLRKEARR